MFARRGTPVLARWWAPLDGKGVSTETAEIHADQLGMDRSTTTSNLMAPWLVVCL